LQEVDEAYPVPSSPRHHAAIFGGSAPEGAEEASGDSEQEEEAEFEVVEEIVGRFPRLLLSLICSDLPPVTPEEAALREVALSTVEALDAFMPDPLEDMARSKHPSSSRSLGLVQASPQEHSAGPGGGQYALVPLGNAALGPRLALRHLTLQKRVIEGLKSDDPLLREHSAAIVDVFHAVLHPPEGEEQDEAEGPEGKREEKE
jgi:hypothetical protein